MSRVDGALSEHNIAERYTPDYIKDYDIFLKNYIQYAHIHCTLSPRKKYHIQTTLIITVLIFNKLCTFSFCILILYAN